MSDTFATAIQAIYDAALSDEHWRPALASIAREAGALGSILLADDAVGLPFRIERASYPIEGVNYYFNAHGQHDRSVMSGIARSYPTLKVLRDVDVWREEDLQNRPDYVFLREQIGARRRALVRLSSSHGWVDLLGLQLSTDWPDWSPQAQHNLERLLPHLAHVIALNRRFSLLRQQYNAALAALDNISIGTCIISPSRHVVLSNSEANRILGLSDGVRQSPTQYIQFDNDETNLTYLTALESVLATANGSDSGSELFFIAPRRSGSRPFIVELSPLRDSSQEIERGFQGALLYLVDPANVVDISAERLSRVFNLTVAETEVCQLMLDGFTAAEASDRRNVAEGTVKTQFRAIYTKTGVSGRVELLRLALSIDPPVRKTLARRAMTREQARAPSRISG